MGTHSAGRPSSLTMVPWPCPSLMVAFTGLVRFTKKVSFSSGLVSPITLTVMVPESEPAGMVSVPEAGT